MLYKLSVPQIYYLYDATRKWFLLVCSVALPAQLVINAPFGRFTPQNQCLTFDGRISWFVMEIVSPIMFAYNLFSCPLQRGYTGFFNLDLTTPQQILAGCYFIHYLNRAIISPLTTPSRSRAHLIVPLLATCFNTLNGFLMGSYLSSPAARAYLEPKSTFSRTSFWIGLGLWALGFAGNVIHDEILANIRRKANRSAAKKTDGDKKSHHNGHSNGKKSEHYAVPHGLLYEYISYPNYFCEWVEWFGFAIAAAPFPVMNLQALLSPIDFLKASPAGFAPTLSPPYIFLLNEFFVMFPRAVKGQMWYKQKFGDGFPKDRKIVIPFVL